MTKKSKKSGLNANISKNKCLVMTIIALIAVFLSTRTNSHADSQTCGASPIVSAPSAFGAVGSHLTPVPSKVGWTEIPYNSLSPVSEKVYLGKNSEGKDTYFCYANFASGSKSFFPFIYLLVDGQMVNPLCVVEGSHGTVGFANGTIPGIVEKYPDPTNIKCYQKKDLNGLNSLWLSFDSKEIDRIGHRYVHVDIILEGRVNGAVRINYYLTNVDNITNIPAIEYKEFSLNGWTHVVGYMSDLKATGYLLSDHRGIYFDSLSGKYRLNVLFRDSSYADNWKASKLGYQFGTVYDTGDEVRPWDPVGDHITLMSSDTLHFKNMPVDLLPGATTLLSWEYSLVMEDVPNITLDQVDQDYTRGDFIISGYWRDYKQPQADLYYQIDNGTPVKFTTISNPTLGTDVPWSYTIPRSVLAPLSTGSTHAIKVWGVNTTNQKSNEPQVVLNFLITKYKLTVKYQGRSVDGTLSDIPGLTADVSENVPGTVFTVSPKGINDGYYFNLAQTKLANQAVTGLTYNDATGAISGTYQDSDLQLIFVYDIGQLVLKVPRLINFVEKKFSKDVNYWPYVTNGNTNEKLEVIDSRVSTQKTNWYVDAKIINSTVSGSETEMPEGMLIFKKNGVEQLLRKTSSVEIFKNYSVTQTPGTVVTPISDTWDKNNGMFIKAERKNVRPGRYVGTVQWTLIKAIP